MLPAQPTAGGAALLYNIWHLHHEHHHNHHLHLDHSHNHNHHRNYHHHEHLHYHHLPTCEGVPPLNISMVWNGSRVQLFLVHLFLKQWEISFQQITRERLVQS